MESPDNQLKRLKKENLILRTYALVSFIVMLSIVQMSVLILIIIFLYSFFVK